MVVSKLDDEADKDLVSVFVDSEIGAEAVLVRVSVVVEEFEIGAGPILYTLSASSPPQYSLEFPLHTIPQASLSRSVAYLAMLLAQ